VFALRRPLRAPKPHLGPSPEPLGPGQSVLLISAREDHTLPALLHTITHDAYKLASRLTYDGFLTYEIVAQRNNPVWTDRPDDVGRGH
jgi:hypothetical protein